MKRGASQMEADCFCSNMPRVLQIGHVRWSVKRAYVLVPEPMVKVKGDFSRAATIMVDYNVRTSILAHSLVY